MLVRRKRRRANKLRVVKLILGETDWLVLQAQASDEARTRSQQSTAEAEAEHTHICALHQQMQDALDSIDITTCTPSGACFVLFCLAFYFTNTISLIAVATV